MAIPSLCIHTFHNGLFIGHIAVTHTQAMKDILGQGVVNKAENKFGIGG